jgi:hypothetical protein
MEVSRFQKQRDFDLPLLAPGHLENAGLLQIPARHDQSPRSLWMLRVICPRGDASCRPTSWVDPHLPWADGRAATDDEASHPAEGS